MVSSRRCMGRACTDRKPASSALGAKRGQRPSTAASFWFTIGSPVR